MESAWVAEERELSNLVCSASRPPVWEFRAILRTQSHNGPAGNKTGKKVRGVPESHLLITDHIGRLQKFCTRYKNRSVFPLASSFRLYSAFVFAPRERRLES
jgi:hypothetical protein